jgi:5-methylcytosine-specific restriction endonuclease McrA
MKGSASTAEGAKQRRAKSGVTVASKGKGKPPKRVKPRSWVKRTRILRSLLYERQGGKCLWCLRETELHKMHLDHIMPRSLGGTDLPINMQLLCAPCNMAKGAKAPAGSQHTLFDEPQRRKGFKQYPGHRGERFNDHEFRNTKRVMATMFIMIPSMAKKQTIRAANRCGVSRARFVYESVRLALEIEQRLRPAFGEISLYNMPSNVTRLKRMLGTKNVLPLRNVRNGGEHGSDVSKSSHGSLGTESAQPGREGAADNPTAPPDHC